MYANMSFREKLIILYRSIFNEALDEQTLQNKNGVQVISNDWNETIQQFYTIFAKQKGFMKCMYDIKMPDEIAIENNLIFIAKERQNVCAYAIEKDTGKVLYLDNTNQVTEPLEMKVDDFILYLIAIQCSQFCACAGRISNCRGLLKSKHDEQRITQYFGDGAVYYFDAGVILVVIGNDAFVSSRDDSAMETFEGKTEFEVDFF